MWLRRDFEDINNDFNRRVDAPVYNNSLIDDYEIRRELYSSVSTDTFNFPGYSFVVNSIGEKEYWNRVDKSFKHFLKEINSTCEKE